MSTLNPSKRTKRRGHLNFMGGRSFDVTDPILALRLAASSSFFGEPMYYHRDPSDRRPRRGRHRAQLSTEQVAHLRSVLDAIDPVEWRSQTPAERMEGAIDAALDADPERTLAEAARLRSEDHVRTTPQVILVRAAHHAKVKGTGLVRRYAPAIVARADEPAVGFAYHRDRFGGALPNALKKAWREALERFDAHQLAKHRLEGRRVSTVDVVNLVHPKSDAVAALARGELRATRTWEAIVSERGASRASWGAALDVMGHMALLRNLRNLLDAGVPARAFVDRLVAGVPTGKQLPFRYYSAYRAIGDRDADVRRALGRCLDRALVHLPRFPGRVMSLCDNSGSARATTTSSMGTMPIASIANLTGVVTATRADEGHVGLFGDRLRTVEIRPDASVLDQLARVDREGAKVGEGTENGIWLFWDRAIREREHWDWVFVYSDMQAGHGGLYGTDASAYASFAWPGSPRYIDVPALIRRYRERVNPQVQVCLVQVAGYRDTIVPELYDRTYVLGGWSEGVLRFAAELAGLTAQRSTSC